MRTIKFRGYNAKNRKWLYGYYFVNRGEHFITPDEIYSWPYPSADDFLVDPESIGQFTGLHDINGKEIYEGDIIKKVTYPFDSHYVVKWDAAYCSVKFYDVSFFKFYLTPHDFETTEFEIVGNIHENPELLKTKDHEEDNVQ
ncbi:MAG: YopX family protein [Bacteroidales bacterium]|nr:YopX family protein [Bacteroidales bacterium]